MSEEPSEALDVLREVWSARGQGAEELDACGESQSCKRMTEVGFDGLAGPDGDLRTAWKAQLEREGKLNAGARGLADLVLAPAPPPSAASAARRAAGWNVRRASAS